MARHRQESLRLKGGEKDTQLPPASRTLVCGGKRKAASVLYGADSYSVLLGPRPLCWQPTPHHSSCLKSSPSHSCLSHSPPAGSQSAASGGGGGGGGGLRTHRVACQEPQASSPTICSRQAGRQAALGLRSGGPHFFACQFLTSGGDERSGARVGWGRWHQAPCLQGSCTLHSPGLGRSALDSETQTPGCL